MEEVKFKLIPEKYDRMCTTSSDPRLLFATAYRIKYLCQVCGNSPQDKGYLRFKLSDQMQSYIKLVPIVLKTLEFALKIAGVPNGVSALGHGFASLFGGTEGAENMVNNALRIASCMEGTTAVVLENDVREGLHSFTNINHPRNKKTFACRSRSLRDDEIKTSLFLIDSDYIETAKEMYGDLKKERKCGVRRVTRNDFDTAWVCSEKCAKCFRNTGRLLIRFALDGVSGERDWLFK